MEFHLAITIVKKTSHVVHIVVCLAIPLKCYKIRGYPPSYKPKGNFSNSVKGKHDKSGYSKPIVNQSSLVSKRVKQSMVNDNTILTTLQCQ